MRFTIAVVLFLVAGHSATLTRSTTILQAPEAQTQIPDSISGHIQDSGGKPERVNDNETPLIRV